LREKVVRIGQPDHEVAQIFNLGFDLLADAFWNFEQVLAYLSYHLWETAKVKGGSHTGCRVEQLNISSDSLGNVFRSRLTACSLDEPYDAAHRAMKVARHFTEICDALLRRLYRKTATSRAQSPLFTRRTQGRETDAVGLASRRCEVVECLARTRPNGCNGERLDELIGSKHARFLRMPLIERGIAGAGDARQDECTIALAALSASW